MAAKRSFFIISLLFLWTENVTSHRYFIYIILSLATMWHLVVNSRFSYWLLSIILLKAFNYSRFLGIVISPSTSMSTEGGHYLCPLDCNSSCKSKCLIVFVIQSNVILSVPSFSPPPTVPPPGGCPSVRPGCSSLHGWTAPVYWIVYTVHLILCNQLLSQIHTELGISLRFARLPFQTQKIFLLAFTKTLSVYSMLYKAYL